MITLQNHHAAAISLQDGKFANDYGVQMDFFASQTLGVSKFADQLFLLVRPIFYSVKLLTISSRFIIIILITQLYLFNGCSR